MPLLSKERQFRMGGNEWRKKLKRMSDLVPDTQGALSRYTYPADSATHWHQVETPAFP